MNQLPDFQSLKVSQSTQAVSRQALGPLDHLFILLPEKPSTNLFRKLPQGTQLERLFRRSKTRDFGQVTSRLNNQRDMALLHSRAVFCFAMRAPISAY